MGNLLDVKIEEIPIRVPQRRDMNDGRGCFAEDANGGFFVFRQVAAGHIGGYPGNYFAEAERKISIYKPTLFICGHSHILKVMPDKKNNLLHMNPGAAGRHGFHKIRTALRFKIENGKILDLVAIELGLRSALPND